MHGRTEKRDGGIPDAVLSVRCRRKDLPVAVPASAKDWTEDASHENGNYESACLICRCKFVGHKRRVFCKQCQNQKAVPAVKRVPVRLWCMDCNFENGSLVTAKPDIPDHWGDWRELHSDNNGGWYVEVPE